MVRSIRAVYQDGIFRPLESLTGLADRTAVKLRVEEIAPAGGRLADFAGRWTPEEADQIAAVIEAEFERVNPSDW